MGYDRGLQCACGRCDRSSCHVTLWLHIVSPSLTLTRHYRPLLLTYPAKSVCGQVLTGPDQDFHAHLGHNQFHLLINEIKWVTSCNVPSTALCQDVPLSAGPCCVTSVTGDDDLNNGSSDPEDGPLTGASLTISPSDSFGPEETSVTLTATDSNGATDSCTTKVTVTDDEAPVVNCWD